MTTKTLPDQDSPCAINNDSDELTSTAKKSFNRRAFVRNSVVAGAALTGAGLLEGVPVALAEPGNGHLTRGDAAILRFLAAAEILETDLWLQYQELAGVQDNEVSLEASQQIPGYPAAPTGGNAPYTNAVNQLDSDMAQYIHDNTDDEFTHETFINAFLMSKGEAPVNLDQFRTLRGSQATGANKDTPRLTNLMQLTVDTSWWTRYRSSSGNPDLGDSFPQAIPSLAVGQHTAIPRTDDDLSDSNFLQAIANTAGWHFAFIEQGGNSLYPSLAQRVSDVEVLRILLSIGPTETMHFQTWQDKAGNALPLTAVDPVTQVSVTFPDLTTSAVGELLQSNLIMPEPAPFLSRKLPACSIIRPTETRNAAMGAAKALTADGLFIGQSQAFFKFITKLAIEADEARRGIR